MGGQGSGPRRSANSPNRGHRDWYQLERWRKLAKAQLRREPLMRGAWTLGALCRRRSLIMSLRMVVTGTGFRSANCKVFARHAIPEASSLKRYTVIIATSAWTAFRSTRGIRSIATARRLPRLISRYSK
jgi:hypothetical protein